MKTRKNERMILTALKVVIAVLAVFGMFWLYGTVGALECDELSMMECFKQSLIGFSSLGVSLVLYKIFFEE